MIERIASEIELIHNCLKFDTTKRLTANTQDKRDDAQETDPTSTDETS